MSDEKPDLTDVRAIRAVTHPVRLALLEYLGDVESATATECAGTVGLSPSATSYHLRELARHGLVSEAPGPDRRERRWRSTGNFRVNPGHDDRAGLDATRLLGQLVTARADRRAQEYMERAATEPAEWWHAATFSESKVRVTAAELSRLTDAIADLLAPYSNRDRADVPEGARRVQLSYRAFPLPDQD